MPPIVPIGTTVAGFAFALPILLLIGPVALFFRKVQPKEKYQGLTLDTINEPLLSRPADKPGA